MPHDDYIRYDASVEAIQPDEAAISAEILASIGRVMQHVFNLRQHAVRQAHAKSQGVLKGELAVYPDLPAHLRQGLFAEPKTYDVIVRLSSAPGDIQSDRAPSNSGMAIKVLGVEGPKADAADASRNQDFLLVNNPVYFGDVGGLLEAAADPRKAGRHARGDPAGGRSHRARREGLASAPSASPARCCSPRWRPRAIIILGETFHSMASLRFGDYIAKLSAAPLSHSVRALTGISAHGCDSAQRDCVTEFFRRRRPI